MAKQKSSDHILTVLISAALLLAVTLSLEAVSRAVAPTDSIDRQYSTYVADADVGFLNRPYSVAKGRASTGEFEYEYLGFRDVEHDEGKPKGVFRILGLGDSFTYGAGARFEEIYLTRTGAQLKEQGVNAEVINQATTFSWPAMERRIFDKYGKRYDPDVVVVGFLPNDIIDTKLASLVTVGADGVLKRKEESSFLAHSSLWKRLNFALFQLKSRIYWKDVYWGSILTSDAWRTIEDDFLLLKKTVESSGARLVIVYIPQQGPWYESHRSPENWMRRWGRTKGITVVPTFDAFREAQAAGKKLFYAANGHCTPEGHRVVADALTQALLKLKAKP